ncbi:MAG: CRISPR-associated endonuclease Cas3'' [Proteobacteria bacterium]|nr:MAG: CRISPR-associated endonuclease Cas3'' [Pseudomonadota bacterium]QKK11574.1 MAG: CRISPR-associated endonuclease Cas3'' [Pseudomonadota bacterium]
MELSLEGRPKPIAHATKDANGIWREPHDLEAHLLGVAELAAAYGESFGAKEWAHVAGLWHDLGKFRARFQRYIRTVSGFEADAHIEGQAGKAPHSTAGALLACDRFGEKGRVLAYLIAGHHAGLSDWHSENSSLQHRLELDDSRAELNEALVESPPDTILDPGTFSADLRAVPGGKEGFALWIRMLFSCLVDADFLDTEAYMNSEKGSLRGDWPEIPQLLDMLDHHMAMFTADAPNTLVNKLRAEILVQCRAKAAEPPGLFSLTVPTGGGKTLSSLAFSLEHAKRHSKRRVIYVIPYTSIIEQTADIYRSIFGDAVIEHHSNAESDPERESHKSRLACENWDAPIVVTTNVQFFESLFAARTSRCRKLHNIVDSVVVLDEAQLLDPHFLQPILDTLRLLTDHYGVSVVLSTATQPALSTREYFDPAKSRRGLDNVREIITDPDTLYRDLKRVEVNLPSDLNTPAAWEVLAREMAAHDSVLAIVNTRKHARELHRFMLPGTLHLSALMCGAHRSAVIDDIKASLKTGAPTRVVSTQLVEAGVDLDFPVVYRALAGLDSIAQAAGRCNREGWLNAEGRMGVVKVFVPPQPAPLGMLRTGEDACKSVLHGYSGDVLDRALFSRYFERLYHDCELDAEGIGKLLEVDGGKLAVNFRTAAERFRLIKDGDTVPVLVLYRGRDGKDGTIDTLIGTLHKEGPQRWLMRKLQRYTVNVRMRDAQRLVNQGDIEELMPGLFVQVNSLLYDSVVGLQTEEISAAAAGLVL